MKKALKILLPLSVVALIIAVDIIMDFSPPKYSPCPTGPIPGTDVVAVRDDTNALYFVVTGGGWLLIDAGSHAGQVEQVLQGLGIHPADVRWILLTHSDSDHVAALPLFSNAEIYMGQGELGLLNGTISRGKAGGNALPPGIDLNAIHLLSGGEQLLFGGIQVECVAMPGHTPGSMAYLIDQCCLFTGDAFQYSKGNYNIHPSTMDTALSRETFAALAERILPGRVILTSHYGYYIP